MGVCGTIGNGYSFAHAKYAANPYGKHIFRDQLIKNKKTLKKRSLGALGVESPHGAAIRTLPLRARWHACAKVLNLSQNCLSTNDYGLSIYTYIYIFIYMLAPPKKNN